MSNDSLHQMTVTYVPEEDRLLFRVGTTEKSEYRFWLTRRFVGVLWNAITDTMKNNPNIKNNLTPRVKDAIVAMSHQEALQDANFSTPHVEDNTNLTEGSGPLLVIGGSLKQASDSITKLNLKTSSEMYYNISMNHQMLHALCHLLITTSETANWNLDLTFGDDDSAVVVPQSPAMLH